MNVLITGSTGFIGSYFIRKYSKDYNITVFSFVRDDLNKLSLEGIDIVIHLSALVHQMAGSPAEAYERVNVDQTVKLAEKARKSGVSQFVFMSTVKVYGEETDVPYTEQSPCAPEDDYGRSKLKAENVLFEMQSDTFKVAAIRTPLVYGFGVKANFQSLINIVREFSVLPFGNIRNKRSMVYIGNLCNLIDVIIKKSASGIFLAADDESLSTSELMKSIAEAQDKKLILICIPFFPSLIRIVKPAYYKRLFMSLEVDNSATRMMLGVVNPFSFSDGIGHTVKNDD